MKFEKVRALREVQKGIRRGEMVLLRGPEELGEVGRTLLEREGDHVVIRYRSRDAEREVLHVYKNGTWVPVIRGS